MAHHHDHGHAHGPANYTRAFAAGVALNTAYILLEGGVGFWTGSLALLSDASHNLSDVLGLLLAWGGHALAQVRPSERRTYGWRSSTILAALFNALALLFVTGGIAWEAVRRFFEPSPVPGPTIMIVAAIGVLINTLTALLFLRGRKDDLNIRGAFLHMAADAGISVAVVLAGLGIRLTGWNWIDPATSLLIAAVILIGTWELFRESLDLAMQAVPKGIDPAQVQSALLELSGVTAVHDLHIWGMSTSEVALTVHLVKPAIENEDSLLHEAGHMLHERFRIAHVTIQVERSEDPANCHQAGHDVV